MGKLTVIVNLRTAVHKGSNGVSFCFPDVCKTPTPGGPVPIPYPNVAKSSDLMGGSATVKMDGNPVMVKGSNFMTSTGDEAGSALGVVSNRIKGKAECVNYSFDVKVEGKNVCRLADPMTHNMGSSANGFSPAVVQSPLAATSPQAESCQEVARKQKEQNDPKKKTTGWDRSGIIPEHRGAIQRVVDELKVYTLFFRGTNPDCGKWIKMRHKPKPHELITAKTLNKRGTGEAETKFIKWLQEFWKSKRWKKYAGQIPPLPAPEDADLFAGLVVSLVDGEPLAGYGTDSNGYSYKGRWITGDYDLMDILHESGDCVRTAGIADFGRIKKTLNKRMGWDGIQHPPQSCWVSKGKRKGGEDYATFSIPKKIAQYMSEPDLVDLGPPPGGWDALEKMADPLEKKRWERIKRKYWVPIAKGRLMPVVDKGLTAVSPSGAVSLETHADVKGALKCFGCDKESAETHDKVEKFVEKYLKEKEG